MAVSYYEIEKAVIDKITKHSNYGIDFSFPNAELPTYPDNLWGKVSNIRSDTVVQDLGKIAGSSSTKGIIQIDVNIPIDHGTGNLLLKIDEIAKTFTVGDTLWYNTTSLRLHQYKVSPDRVVNGYTRITLSIPYEVWAQR